MEINKCERQVQYYFEILLLSFFISKFNIDVGFSLKPYMIVSLIGFFIFRKSLFLKTTYYTNSDKTLFILGILAGFSFFIAVNSKEALRHIILLYLNFAMYLINRKIFKNSMIDFEVAFRKISLIIISFSILLYILGMLNLNFDFSKNRIISYGVLTDRNFPRLIGSLSHDPNIAAFYLTPLILFSLNDIQYKGYLFIFISLLVILMLTLSRGGILGIFFGIGVFIFLKRAELIIYLKNNLKKLLFTIIILILVFYKLDLINTILLRFSNSISTGGSGRTKLWLEGISFFKFKPCLGYGINNSKLLLIPLVGNPKYLHNTFLEILIEFGIVGFSVYMILVYQTFRTAFSHYKEANNAFFITTYLAMLLQAVFLSLTVNEFWFLFYLLLYIYSDNIAYSEGQYE